MRKLIELSPTDMLKFIAEIAPKRLYAYETPTSVEPCLWFNPSTSTLQRITKNGYLAVVDLIPAHGYIEVEWFERTPVLAARVDAPDLIVTIVRMVRDADGEVRLYDVPGHKYSPDRLVPVTKDNLLITNLLKGVYDERRSE